MIEIEKLYRITVHYDVDLSDDSVEKIEKLSDMAEKICTKNKVKMVENNTGGPCWNAYFVAESDNPITLEKVASSFVSYLKKFKGGKIF